MKNHEKNDRYRRESIRHLAAHRVICLSRQPVWLLLVVAGLFSVAAVQAKIYRQYDLRGVDVMQVNLYVGSGLERVAELDPADPEYFNQLVGAVTGIYAEVLASEPTVRLKGVAHEIAARKPDIISLEEASLIRIESPGNLVFGGNNSATNVVYDYLQILMDQLKKQGLHYTVAAVTTGLDVELPGFNQQTGGFDDVRLTDREAILVRTDYPRDKFYTSNPQGGNFTNVVVTAAGLPLLYGWCSVDMHIRGRNFRYICAHLTEESDPAMQVLQARELLEGPANVNLSVMIVGDFNADPLHRDGSVAYDEFISAGFSDAWAVKHWHNLDGGLTWGHDELLADPGTKFDRRIDLMFFRGNQIWPMNNGTKTWNMRLNRKDAPLWSSDHAAVTTAFWLE